MNKCKSSIKYKYTLYIFIVSTIVAIVSIITSSLFFYNISKKNFIEETDNLYNKLKPKIVYSIKNLKYLDLENKLSYLTSTKEINGIVIVDENGNTLIEKGIKKGFEIKKDFNQGKLIVYFSKLYLHNLIKSMIIKMIFVFMLIIPFIVFVTFLLVKLKLKNFFHLSDMIKRIGNPEYTNNKEFSLEGNDEIARLAEILKEKHFQLIKSREQLYLLHKTIEQCYNSIVITDTDGNIQYANSAFSRITGYSIEEVLGKNPRILKSGRQSEEFYKNLWDTILKGEIWEGRLVNKRKNETFYIEKMIITPVKNENNEIQNFIAIKQDITREVEYEKKLIRMEKMKTVENMASGIAHEINNILTTVVSYPEILKMYFNDREKLIEGLKKIQLAGLKISDILVELTSLSSNIALPKQKINLNQIITNTLKFEEIGELLKIKPDTKITLKLDKNLFPIKGSKAHIQKSLINLIKNAIEAIERDGEIIIQTENIYLDEDFANKNEIMPGNYIKLTIKDSGRGISSEDIDKIFEPFFTKKKLGRKSTGVGLTIVLNTVKAHKGLVLVESGDDGTRFELYFPALKEECIQEKESFIDKKDVKILVVDDEENQRKIISDILSKTGFQVFDVPSGEEAVNFVKNNNIDLIILDMIMSTGIDGCETFERIKEFNPEQRAIIISGMSYSERINRALRLGIKNYIKKPYTSKQLIDAVKKALNIN